MNTIDKAIWDTLTQEEREHVFKDPDSSLAESWEMAARLHGKTPEEVAQKWLHAKTQYAPPSGDLETQAFRLVEDCYPTFKNDMERDRANGIYLSEDYYRFQAAIEALSYLINQNKEAL